jgi:hypothetical protein
MEIQRIQVQTAGAAIAAKAKAEEPAKEPA